MGKTGRLVKLVAIYGKHSPLSKVDGDSLETQPFWVNLVAILWNWELILQNEDTVRWDGDHALFADV
jgi:hypothetical protein